MAFSQAVGAWDHEHGMARRQEEGALYVDRHPPTGLQCSHTFAWIWPEKTACSCKGTGLKSVTKSRALSHWHIASSPAWHQRRHSASRYADCFVMGHEDSKYVACQGQDLGRAVHLPSLRSCR